MARVHRHVRTTPRGDDLDDWWANGSLHVGSAGTGYHPWDWTDATAQELADELEEALARKKSVGFAPWPADDRPPPRPDPKPKPKKRAS